MATLYHLEKCKCTFKEVKNKDYEYYKIKYKGREPIKPKQLMMVDVWDQVAKGDFKEAHNVARKMSNLKHVRYVHRKSVLI